MHISRSFHALTHCPIFWSDLARSRFPPDFVPCAGELDSFTQSEPSPPAASGESRQGEPVPPWILCFKDDLRCDVIAAGDDDDPHGSSRPSDRSIDWYRVLRRLECYFRNHFSTFVEPARLRRLSAMRFMKKSATLADVDEYLSKLRSDDPSHPELLDMMRVRICGARGAGKTSLLLRFVYGQVRAPDHGIGVAFLRKEIQFKLKTTAGSGRRNSFLLELWDTGGQEHWRSMPSLYFRSSSIHLMCYDVTSRESLEVLEDWFRDIDAFLSKESEDKISNDNVLFVACKCDVSDETKVSKDDLWHFLLKVSSGVPTGLARRTFSRCCRLAKLSHAAAAPSSFLPYVECSSATGVGVEEVFATAARIVDESDSISSRWPDVVDVSRLQMREIEDSEKSHKKKSRCVVS